MAVPDSYNALENTPLSVSAGNGVLANDSDADADPITAIGLTQTSHGAVGINGDGSFVYYPNTGYTGPDSFTYKANDGFVDSNTVTVTIRVDAPPIVTNKSYTDVQNTSLDVLAGQGLLVGATDPDGDPLTVVDVTQPSHGTVTVNPDGSFSYVPTAGYYGNDSFTFSASDGITSSLTPATVTLNVIQDHAPVTVNDSQTVGEGGFTSSAPGILANDTDADGDPLTALLVSGPAHGTLAFHGDGSYTYIPNSSLRTAGSDSFSYRAFDGVLAGNVATVTLTFNPPPAARPVHPGRLRRRPQGRPGRLHPRPRRLRDPPLHDRQGRVDPLRDAGCRQLDPRAGRL